MSRRFVIKAGTLTALGGGSALNQLMAACAGGGAQSTTTGGELAAGAFKYSRFPLVEKYNWRLVKWDMTPYHGGTFMDGDTKSPQYLGHPAQQPDFEGRSPHADALSAVLRPGLRATRLARVAHATVLNTGRNAVADPLQWTRGPVSNRG